MLRRALIVVGGLVAITGLAGCQEFELHTKRLEVEFRQFHTDIHDIFFGIDPPPPPKIWNVYE